MLEVQNRTPFTVQVAPAQDIAGADFAVVVIKGTFSWENRGALAVSEEPVPVLHADVFSGETDTSSIRYAADVCLRKRGTDVALVGQAYAPEGRVTTHVDVGLRVGPVTSALRVFGDRHWSRVLGIWRISPPVPFDRMPLIYERAYGGVDTTHPDAAKHAGEMRNPVGTGFCSHRSSQRLEGLPLPNLEALDARIEHWKDRPAPVGFGFIGRGWEPRCRYAGTYDARWERERAPLLPLDFDERYYSAAHPSLVCQGYLVGGEPVHCINVTPGGTLAFALPRYKLSVDARLQGKLLQQAPVLDTVVIEPDERRLLLTWRTAIPCTRKFLYLERVVVEAQPWG
jgi:hypothetical protein